MSTSQGSSADMLSAVSQTCSLPVVPTDRGSRNRCINRCPSPNAVNPIEAAEAHRRHDKFPAPLLLDSHLGANTLLHARSHFINWKDELPRVPEFLDELRKSGTRGA